MKKLVLLAALVVAIATGVMTVQAIDLWMMNSTLATIDCGGNC
jgi:hypothetical protein